MKNLKVNTCGTSNKGVNVIFQFNCVYFVGKNNSKTYNM